MPELGLLGMLGPVTFIGNEGLWVGLVLAFGGSALAWKPISLLADCVEPFKGLHGVHARLRTPKSRSLIFFLRVIGITLLVLGLYILVMKGLTQSVGVRLSWSS